MDILRGTKDSIPILEEGFAMDALPYSLSAQRKSVKLVYVCVCNLNIWEVGGKEQEHLKFKFSLAI